jgi:hypothetical protein
MNCRVKEGIGAAPELFVFAEAALTAFMPPVPLPRQVSTNDIAMAVLPLLERPPWQRRGRGGALERFAGGGWQPVAAADRHRLAQQEGQVGKASHLFALLASCMH